MTAPIELEKPIPRGEGQIAAITLRKPDAGALRGLPGPDRHADGADGFRRHEYHADRHDGLRRRRPGREYRWGTF